MSLIPSDVAAAMQRILNPGATWPTPGDLARHLNPRIRQTPALDLIDAELARLINTPDGRLIISMSPQEGKSQRASRAFPLWALLRNPDTRVAIASYEHGVARRWGRAIRDDLTTHRLGLRIRDDLSAQHEWQLSGREGGVYSVGIGAALTGRPVDLLIIDDPIKDRQQADSKTFRDRVWDWWTEVGATRLAPGAPVCLILTRWHEDDLAGRLLDAADGRLWRVINIPAQCEDPDTDPLGRQVGEFMESARGRTREQWEAIKTRSGPRTWASLYQGRPAPSEGALFRRDAWQRYDRQPWLESDGVRMVNGGDRLIQSWDLSFKGSKTADWVVGQVWWQRSAEYWLLDQMRGRWGFSDTCERIRAMSARWPQTTAKLVEDKANGPAVIDALKRTVPGLVPVNPAGGKESRAAAVEPFVAAGNVHLPASHLAPWVDDLIEEAAAFPNAAHDDQVDALSQALTHLGVTQPTRRVGTGFFNIG